MEKKICRICDTEKNIDDFNFRLGERVDYCKECLKTRITRYDEFGINLPVEEQSAQQKFFIAGAKEILTAMGYDPDLPVYPQFKQRMRLKYGKDMF